MTRHYSVQSDFGTRMTRIKLIYTDFLINKMKIKKNNLGKTDLIRIILFLSRLGGIKYPFLSVQPVSSVFPPFVLPGHFKPIYAQLQIE